MFLFKRKAGFARVAWPVGIFVVLALAGCGGGGSSGSDSTSASPPLGTAQFIKRADAICRQAHRELRAQFAAYRREKELNNRMPAQSEREDIAVTIIVPNIRGQAEKLGELGPPKGEEAEAAAVVSAVENVANEAESEPLSVLATSAWSEVREVARKMGLSECSHAF
jgi:hypothetical protein